MLTLKVKNKIREDVNDRRQCFEYYGGLKVVISTYPSSYNIKLADNHKKNSKIVPTIEYKTIA